MNIPRFLKPAIIFGSIIIVGLAFGIFRSTISSSFYQEDTARSQSGYLSGPDSTPFQRALARGDRYFGNRDYLNAKASYQVAIDLIPGDSLAKAKLRKTMDLLRSQKAQNILFDVAIASADKLFQEKDYERARQEYENAAKLMPSDTYPKQKINEIIKIQVDKQVTEEKYAAALSKADAFYHDSDFRAALPEYQIAVKLKPEQKYPADKVAELTVIVKALKAKDDAYNKAISKADPLFKSGQYEGAKGAYKEAIAIKPDQVYPKARISEIEGIIARQKKLKEDYEHYINLGDSLYIAKVYLKARENYKLALSVKPDESYPKEMVLKAEGLLTGQEAAMAKALDEQYASAIAGGDKLLTAKSYELARTEYQKAAGLKPQEQYPKDKISEIGKILGDEKATDDLYKQSIAVADKLFAQKRYDQAKAEYQKASGFKPAEKYPFDQISIIEGIYHDLEAELLAKKSLEEQFSQIIVKADKLLSEKSYDQAKQEYQNALNLKTNEVYPKTKIAEIDQALAVIAKQQALDAEYNRLVEAADKLLNEKSYAQAKTQYLAALKIKPGTEYLQSRITEIDIAMQDLQKQKALDDQYAAAVSKADKLLAGKTYELAKNAYVEAGKIKPNEQYPKDKIAETDKILSEIAEQKVLDDKYRTILANADKLLLGKSYEPARAEYVNASGLKPGEQYPKDKIAGIDKTLAELSAKRSLDEQYAQLIVNADKLLSEKSYDQAKQEYQNALNLKTNEVYPKTKIAEIDQALAVIAKQQALDAAYNQLVEAADKLLNEKSYAQAKLQYQAALKTKPAETYPQSRISEIDIALEDLQKQKALDDQYAAAVSKADKLLAGKTYELAKNAYVEAGKIKPNEQYPKDKIAETDKILSEIAEQKVLDDKYRTILANADKLLLGKSYEPARAEYVNASGLKPGEQYPKDKIAGIDKTLAELSAKRSLDEQYAQLIVNADKLLSEKSYDQAKQEYQNALNLKTNEVYPKTKIAEIDQALAVIAKQQALDAAYNQLVEAADKLLNEKSYAQAKIQYLAALKTKPAETYPQSRISEIDIALEDLQKQKALDDQYAAAVSKADKLLAGKTYELAKNAYVEAGKIKPNEQYPKDKIAETDKILSEIAEQKVLDDKYRTILANADKLLLGKSYEPARAEYVNASGLKPGEQYPKDKIAGIDKTLAELSAKRLLDEQYAQLIVNADKLLSEKSYDQAKQEYQNALNLKTNEVYPKTKIAEIDQALAVIAKQQALDEQYNRNIMAADKLLLEKSYEPARQKYQESQLLKPAEQYPKTRIAEIDLALKVLAQQKALDDRYAEAVSKADQLLSGKSYDLARTAYIEAGKIKPDEQYHKDKLAETDKIISEIAAQKVLDGKYKAYIDNADKLLLAGSYDQARTEYLNAGSLKPTEQYPKDKISGIDKTLADIKALEEAYATAIAAADKLLAGKSFELAKAEYQKANQLKPAEIYPKTKITEIDNIVNAALARQRLLDQQYQAALNKADKSMADKSFEQARLDYMNAAKLKPEEQYPRDRILELENIIAENKAKEEAYKTSLTKADGLLLAKKYDDARSEYENAAVIKPESNYPAQKIAEINKTLEEILGKRKLFENLLVGGDAFLNAKEYNKAIAAYKQAAGLFPEESAPREKTALVNAKIDSIYRANKGKYDKVVGDADRFFNAYEYDKAIDAYTEAIAYLPMENYPREMVSKIRKIIAENAIVDVFKSSMTITAGEEKQFPFSPVNMAARKNNFIYIKVKNLSNKSFNVLLRYGKDKQPGGGVVIKNLSTDGKVNERLISVMDQDSWYRLDNNWISLYPQGGDIEVTFIQISRSR